VSGKKRPIPAAGGLFDDFAQPFALQQQSIPKPPRGPLRLLLRLELRGKTWRQTDDVLARSLTDAAESALMMGGHRRAPVWSFPVKGAAVANVAARGSGITRVAVIDPELATLNDLPVP